MPDTGKYVFTNQDKPWVVELLSCC